MIKLHNTLCEDIWAGDTIREAVRDRLLEIAADFTESLKIKSKPNDITLTGSIANYNYTAHSDIDLHVLYDLSSVECDQELTRDYVLAKKSLWNDKHDIYIYGREVEVYVQDTKEPHVSTGVYSIVRGEWISRPVHKSVSINRELLDKKLNEYVDLIEHNLKRKTNHNFLKKLRSKISAMRKEGLASGGQYSIENMVFKELRNKGYLDKLAELENQSYDKSMSMESFADFVRKYR